MQTTQISIKTETAQLPLSQHIDIRGFKLKPYITCPNHALQQF